MVKYKAVLFDLDGTLLNTLGDLTDSVNYALASFGYPVRTEDEVRMRVGNGVAKLMERAVPDGTETEQITEALALFRAYYAAHNRVRTAPYDGILPLLDRLKQEKTVTAIVSNKFDAAVKQLSDFYFGDRIAVAIGENLPSRKRKPAPDSVFEALRLLGISKEDAVYIGDTAVDAETAKNAGLPCIGCAWGFRGREALRQAGVTQIADTVEELYRFLVI